MNDIFQEWLVDHKCNFDIVIASAHESEDSYYDVIGIAWRKPNGEWHEGRGYFSNKDLRPHPDPEQAWADYCAWVLTK
jgi:hypothetical protein